MKNVQEVTAQPVRWVIVVSITDPIRKNQVVSAKHECSSLAHARTLLTEIREMAAEFGEYLPGLSVDTSRMSFAPDFFSKMEPAMQRA